MGQHLETEVAQPELDLYVAPPPARLNEWFLARAQLPATPEQAAEAEADIQEFMRNMNAPRKDSGERLPYPEAERQ